MRKLFVLALAMLAARLAKRALKRGAGQYAEIMAALWQVTELLLAASTSSTAKTRNVEDRLNALVPRIPVPQPAPGTSAGGTSAAGNSSYSSGNNSYDMAGGTAVTSNPGGNDGGNNSHTSGQIGGASAHYHDMTHYHVSSAALQDIFNATRDSYSSTVTAFNQLRQSHSDLVPVVNNLVSDHGQLIADHNNLKAAIISSGLLH